MPDDSVYTWPNLLIAELFVFVLTVSLILVVSLLFNAPLEAAGQRDAPAESGEGAVVLPRAAGDGELLGVLGRHRHSRTDGGAADRWSRISTATRAASGAGSRRSGCLRTRCS